MNQSKVVNDVNLTQLDVYQELKCDCWKGLNEGLISRFYVIRYVTK